VNYVKVMYKFQILPQLIPKNEQGNFCVHNSGRDMWHEWERRGTCIGYGRKARGKETTRKTET
jgi:hypothetical protein